MLNATGHEASDEAKQSEMKAMINGVIGKMKEFNILSGLMLADNLLKHSDNFSQSVQTTSMPAIEAHCYGTHYPGSCLEAVLK